MFRSVFALGGSTFGLSTVNRKSICENIGSRSSTRYEFFSRNALQLNEIPQDVISRILDSEVLIVHVGVADCLPKLSKRIYPLPKALTKNGLLYFLNDSKNVFLSHFLNCYNSLFFNMQLKLHINLVNYRPNSIYNFFSHTFISDQSKIDKIFFLGAPPIRHPGAGKAIEQCNSEIKLLQESFKNIEFLNYDELCIGLKHDSTGHLIPVHRDIFVDRLVSRLQS